MTLRNGLIALAVLVVVAGVVGLVLYLRARRRAVTHLNDGQALTGQRLYMAWQSFLQSLPSQVRMSIPDYTHFIVFGAAGSGKTSMITKLIDWHGQANQFLPSYTADPLVQIYLGNKVVAIELGAPLLETTTRAANQALRRLFTALYVKHPPTVVVTLKLHGMGDVAPDRIRQQAQLIRGKINLLSEVFDAAIRTRICLTFMERIKGYPSFARFLSSNRVNLTLELGREGAEELVPGLDAYEKYLPRALTTRSIADFEAMILLFKSAPDILGPVRAFVGALLESAVVAIRPELQKLYFFSPPAPEHVGSPFEGGEPIRTPARPTTWLWRLLTLGGMLHLRPWHTLLSALLIFGLIGSTVWGVRRHGALVAEARDAVDSFDAAVRRARSSVSPPHESDVVRRTEWKAGQKLDALFLAESRFLPLKLLYRRDKRALGQKLVDDIRQGYILPILEAGKRQRSRDRILFTLVVLYASRTNTLGQLVRTQPADFATTIGMPQDTALDYVKYSEESWPEVALLLLPPLLSSATAEQRDATVDPSRWRRLVYDVDHAIALPYITYPQLQGLQKEARFLLEVVWLIKKDSLVRQIYRLLSEESPLDMLKLFGQNGGTLNPGPFLTDNMEHFEGLLGLVNDSSFNATIGGRISLYRLLKWINDLSSRRGKLPLDDTYHIAFIDKSYDISKQAWLDLLFRSRKRLMLSPAFAAGRGQGSGGGKRKATNGDQCPIPQKPRPRSKQASRPCPDGCMCTIQPGEPGATAGGDDGKRSGEERDGAADASRDAATQAARPGDGLLHGPSRHHKRGREHGGKLRGIEGQSIPIFNKDEFTPKLAALLTSDDLPAAGLGDLYNRAVFNKEILPLVQELKKALASSDNLSPEEKIYLSRLVQNEVRAYARRYCAALIDYHQSFQFAQGAGSLHSALLDLVKPGSPFVEHLRTVSDNASLDGMGDPYLKPMAECVAAFQPITRMMAGKDGSYPGLGPYNEAITQLIADLDGPIGDKGGNSAPASDKPPTLLDRLPPAGKTALRMNQAADGTPLRKVEQFLDKAGVAGALRRPFLAPFAALYRHGVADIEHALDEHWQKTMLPQITPLLSRFPFDRKAEREVEPGELEALNPAKGSFWTQLRTFYAPVLSEQGGTWVAQGPATADLGALTPPKDMLPALNQLSRLSGRLFKKDGERQALRLTARSEPLPTLPGMGTPSLEQPTLSFIAVGKSSAYGFNQLPTPRPIEVEWWAQGVSSLGIEYTAPGSNRKQTQSVEVSSSPWSFYRLLQKGKEGPKRDYTFSLPGEGKDDGRPIRYVFDPDPWETWSVRLTGEGGS